MATMDGGTLLGIVLAQLVRPGTPVGVPGWNGGPYNLQTMVGKYVLAGEQGVATAMGKYYDLPVFGLGGSTDLKVLDQQCGAEVALSLFTALLSGANIVQGSLALVAIADDLLSFLRAACQVCGKPFSETAGTPFFGLKTPKRTVCIALNILKLARMIADLAGSERIETAHLAEAIQYRPRRVV